MQYPIAGSPPQGPPYSENSHTSSYRQGQGYPSSNPPYPVSNSPYPPAAEPATSRGESAGYYGNTQPYGGPQSTPPQYQNQNSTLYGGANYSQHYTPPNQYNPHQQYPPSFQGPYGGTPSAGTNPGDPLQYQQHYDACPPNSSPAAYPPGSVPQTDEERGLMGALAGGAAGGFAGHKMDHGIIGTLGGAYAGHKLEDKYKEHHSRPAPAAQQTMPPVSPMPAQQHYSGQQMLGNFSSSASKISMDGDYDLIAECTTINGHQKLSSISLNKVLSNDNGHFKWVHDGGNFAGSARNIQLLDGGKKLEAELCRGDGSWVWDRIYLDEKITNEDGELKSI
ncbi:putative glutamine-serine-proline rich [Venturia nashicola]|uniref:Putative glutamine-serine-proline rich n=1 Tax=Venturia nashicola TaxID=86259 RepID=A0A4Z1P9Z6_9PEZI|nr:putative glutamine-serine-proline rich [Venturia nashicola]